MPRSWFAVQASAPDSAEIALRGYIGDFGITDRDLIAEVEALGDVKEITLRINSRGGQVDHALSIFNYLREHPAQITVRVEGVAMSAATIPLMAADAGLRVMPANTLIMMHNPFVPGVGEDEQDDKYKEVMSKFVSLLVATYVSATGRSEEDIRQILEEETYMTADEAKANGFVDVVEPLSSARAPNTLASVMACAMGIPEDVLARVQAAELQDDSQSKPSADGAPEGGDPVSGDPAAQAGDAGGAGNNAPQASASTLATQIVALAGEFGLQDHVGVFALATDIACAASARSAMQAACEVRDLCGAVGMADQAASLIQARTGMAEARAKLQTLLAERADAHPVSSYQKPQSRAVEATSQKQVTSASIWEARRKSLSQE